VARPGDWEARIEAILGDDTAGDIDDCIEKLFDHLTRNLVLPCEVTGVEDFDWEEPYVVGGLSPSQYRELKKTQPSYRDVYTLLSIDLDTQSEWMLCPGEDIAAHVRRRSDNREFWLGLAELKAVDKGSANQQLLDDYGKWFFNSR
jgi:hypothetical protein